MGRCFSILYKNFCSQTLFILVLFTFPFLAHSYDKKQATNGYKYNSESPYGIFHGCGKGYSQSNNDNSQENVSLVFLCLSAHQIEYLDHEPEKQY